MKSDTVEQKWLSGLYGFGTTAFVLFTLKGLCWLILPALLTMVLP